MAARSRSRPEEAPSSSAPRLVETEAPIVVVSGLPRSGTSMLMQMLEAGGVAPFTDRSREPDDNNPRGYFEHEAVKSLARDASWVPEASGHAVKVVAPLLPYLPTGPRYLVVVLDRDLGEVLASQTAMLARDGIDAAPTAALRASYTRHLAAARAWIERTPGAEAIPLEHRDVVSAPADAARSLAHALSVLGFDVNEEAMAAVVDPTLHRQRAR